MKKSPIYLSLIALIFASCSKDSKNDFDHSLNLNSSITGSWSTVAEDFTKTNMYTKEVDSVFSFTGALKKEIYSDSLRVVSFLTHTPDTFFYVQNMDQVTFYQNSDTISARLLSLNAKNLAYTTTHTILENDTLYELFSSVQLSRD